jgi:hypothetical protein
LKNLGKVYTWFMAKLDAIGALSNADKDEEESLMNPNRIEDL